MFCAACGSLGSRVKHPCFGLKLLSRSKLFSIAEEISQTVPTLSTIYVPIELRTDCAAALRALLSARELLDEDQFTPALFMLAKLRRGCLSCLADDPAVKEDFHSCRAGIEACIGDYAELACWLFNVKYTPQVAQFFRVFLTDHSFD